MLHQPWPVVDHDGPNHSSCMSNWSGVTWRYVTSWRQAWHCDVRWNRFWNHNSSNFWSDLTSCDTMWRHVWRCCDITSIITARTPRQKYRIVGPQLMQSLKMKLKIISSEQWKKKKTKQGAFWKTVDPTPLIPLNIAEYTRWANPSISCWELAKRAPRIFRVCSAAQKMRDKHPAELGHRACSSGD